MTLFLTTAIGLMLTLGLAALGGLFSERSGVINIGIEGMMTMGALIWALSGVFLKSLGNSSQILAFILAGFSGSIIALLHGFVCVTLRGNQIVSGTTINLLTAGIALYVCYGFDIGTSPGLINSFYQPIGFNQTRFGSNVSVLIIPIILFFIFSWWLLKKTAWGLRLRTVGENPLAAEAAGIDVIRKRYQALIISGFVSGISGGFFVQYLGGSFSGSVQGYGFLALGILIFGQWKVHFVGIATIIFSALSTFALVGRIQFDINWLNQIPRQFLDTIPFVASLLIMIVTSKTMAGPRALGMPYQKIRSNN